MTERFCQVHPVVRWLLRTSSLPPSAIRLKQITSRGKDSPPRIHRSPEEDRDPRPLDPEFADKFSSQPKKLYIPGCLRTRQTDCPMSYPLSFVLQESLHFEFLSPNSISFVPVDLSHPDATIREADLRFTFPLSPTTRTIDFLQSLKFPNPTTKSDSLWLENFSKYLNVQDSPSPSISQGGSSLSMPPNVLAISCGLSRRGPGTPHPQARPSA